MTNPCNQPKALHNWDNSIVFLLFAVVLGTCFYWCFFKPLPFCDDTIAKGCGIIGDCRACPFFATCDRGAMVKKLFSFIVRLALTATSKLGIPFAFIKTKNNTSKPCFSTFYRLKRASLKAGPSKTLVGRKLIELLHRKYR